MRGLSALELHGLTDMIARPDHHADDDDPIAEAWDACAERGLAAYRDDGEVEYWEVNDLGRLALRVHQAVNQ